MPIVITDLHNTLQIIGAGRGQLLAAGKWAEFGAGINKDLPNRPILLILKLLAGRGISIHIHTGGGEELRAPTEAWLKRYAVDYDVLVMRPDGDRTPDYLLKRDWLRSGYNKAQILCVLDDRTPCVRMYRQEGLTCLQVDQDATQDVQKVSQRLDAECAAALRTAYIRQ